MTTTSTTAPRTPTRYAFQDGTTIDPADLPPVLAEDDFTGAWKLLMIDRGTGRSEIVRVHYDDGSFKHARVRVTN